MRLETDDGLPVRPIDSRPEPVRSCNKPLSYGARRGAKGADFLRRKVAKLAPDRRETKSDNN